MVRNRIFLSVLFSLINLFPVLAQLPLVSVRFNNARYDCITRNYCLQVEFQCNMPEKQLLGMNIRFFYDDKVLEFLSISNIVAGYKLGNPDPPMVSTGNESSGAVLFGLTGPAEFINGAIQKVGSTPVTYLSTTGWTRLFDICFYADNPNALQDGLFCPAVIWDLEENSDDGGFLAGDDGVVISLVAPPPLESQPASEKVYHANWNYDGISGIPYGKPGKNLCLALPCFIDARDDTGPSPVDGTAGGTAIADILANDKLNGLQATTASVTITAVSDPSDGVTLNTATGAVTVTPGTVSGTYYITYKICEKGNPSNCDEALITVVVRTSSQVSADLTVIKTVNNKLPDIGSNIIFYLKVINKGPSNATGVIVADALPSGFTFVNAVPLKGSWAYPDWNIGNLSAGDSAMMDMVVRVNSTGVYDNIAFVSGNEPDPVPGNNSDAESVIPFAVKQADLSIVKTVSNATPSVGSNVTFTLTATNYGISAATGVTVTDILPAGFTLISATPSIGSWSAPDWNIGSMVLGASGTLIIVVRVNATGPYTNTASIRGNEADPNDRNNSDTRTVNPEGLSQADLSMAKTVSNPAPNAGENVTFTLTAKNNGPANATSVKVTDILPAGFTLISATPSGGTWSAPVWNLNNLNAGSSATLAMVVRVNSTGPYLNTAVIAGYETDPVPGNNTDSKYVIPAGSETADLSIIKTVNNSTPDFGMNITFTLTAKNNGPLAATAVMVNDILPSGYTLLSAVPSSGSWSAPTWSVNNLGVGITKTLTITARVNNTGTYTNTATILGFESDPFLENNTSTVSVHPLEPSLVAVNEHLELCNTLIFKGNVLDNGDYAAGGGTLTVQTTPVESPVHGSFIIGSDGKFTYTPQTGYAGPDRIIVNICNASRCIHDTVFVTVFAGVEANAGEDFGICGKTSVQLKGNSVAHAVKGWGWISGPNEPSITGADSTIATLTGIIPGIYRYAYKLTLGGCADADTIQFTVFTPPTAFAGKDISLCSGSSYQVADAEAGNYGTVSWTTNGSGTLTGSNTLRPTYTAGKNETGYVVLTLHVTPKGKEGCQVVTDDMLIQVVSVPILNCPLIKDFIVDVTPGTCHWASPAGSLSPGYTSGGCIAGLIWKVVHPDKSTEQGNGDISGFIFRLGKTTVTYILKDQAGNQVTSCTFTVEVIDREKPVIICPPPVSVRANPGECDAEVKLVLPQYLDNCSQSVVTEYTVSPPDNSLLGPYPGTQLNFRFAAGNNQVEWTLTDISGNIIKCRQLVTVITGADQLKPEAGDNASACEGSSWQLTQASAPVPVTFKWTSNGTGSFTDPSVLKATYIPSQADILNGKVVLTLTASTKCASASDFMTLTITAKPLVNAGPDLKACQGEPLNISQASAKNSSLNWVTNGQGILSGKTTVSPQYTPANGEKGNLRFVLEGTGTAGCSNVVIRDTLSATLYTPPDISTNGDRTILPNSRTTLISNITNGSGNYLFHWEPVSLVAAPNAGSTETLPVGSSTRFFLTVTDAASGCTGKDTISVTVSGNMNDLIIFYNALTPNGDGINDVWYMDGIEQYPDNKVLIFNRWGDKIIEYNHYGQNGLFWDGKNKQGKRVPDGTYYFVVKVKDLKDYTGWIQVKSSF